LPRTASPPRSETGFEKRPFGRTDREVSVIGEGTWYIERSDRRSVVAALRRGLDLGMNLIDTAEIYGSGRAEEIVGEAIAGRRDEAFLVSKVMPQNASREGTIKACERSLARLKTESLDCYLLHWRGDYPLEETISSFEELKRRGKISSWGVSNFDVPDLEDAWDSAGGSGRITTNQVLYHLQDRAIEHAILPWCEKHDVAVLAYSPYGHGDFPGPDTAGGKALQKIAEGHHATPRQVALSFLTRSPSVFAIPKASTPEHVEENAGASKVRLTEEELALIDRAFPIGPPRGLPML